MIRATWVLLNLLVATFSLSSIAILAMLVRSGPRPYDWLARTWSKWILWVSGTPVKVEGMENIRMDAAQVFVANHVSWYDVFALAAVIPKRYRFVAKKELARIPIFGQAWKAAGHISVDRSDRMSAIQSLDQAGRLIRSDASSVVIFPEGTRSPSATMLPFKKGAFMLALHTGVDIVPAAVCGTRSILPKGAWRVRPGLIIVRFGRPIPTEGLDESRREELMGEVRRQIEALLEGRPAVEESSV